MTFLSWLAAPLAMAMAATAQPDVITLPEALAHTLENNFDVALERINVDSAQADIQIAFSEFDPSMEAFLGSRANRSPAASAFSDPEINEADGMTGSLGVSGKTQFGASYKLGLETGLSNTNSSFQSIDPAYETALVLELSQPLLKNAGRDTNTWRLRTGLAGKAIAEGRLRAMLLDAASRTIEAYWELVFARENLKTQNELLEWSRQFEGMVRQKVEAGALARIETIQAQASTAAAEEQAVGAKSELDRRADILLQLMNPAMDSRLWSEPILPGPMPAAPPADSSKRDYMALALANSPELEAARKEVENARVSLGYYENQKLPSLDVVATMRLNGLRGDARPVVDVQTGETRISQLDGSASDSLSDSLSGKYYDYTVGLRLTWPFGGRGDEGRHAKSMRQLQTSVIRLQELEKRVAMEARNARREVVNADERFQAASVARALAEEKLDAEMKKFVAGASTLFNTLQYRQELATQRGRELRAIADCHISRARLDRALGETLQANGLTLDSAVLKR
ncbi:MAG: TolC family protein [Nitrospinota bacterium]|nr:TolC family protein [Nitrospinota bacterium]MDH5679343.1 TolC family protein [Nitrospinota bacterium]